jgi:hypothetical protein
MVADLIRTATSMRWCRAQGTACWQFAFGSGTGTFRHPPIIPFGWVQPNAISVRDLDGDGMDDVATANDNGTITILLSAEPPPTPTAPPTATPTATPTLTPSATPTRNGNCDVTATAHHNTAVATNNAQHDPHHDPCSQRDGIAPVRSRALSD